MRQPSARRLLLKAECFREQDSCLIGDAALRDIITTELAQDIAKDMDLYSTCQGFVYVLS